MFQCAEMVFGSLITRAALITAAAAAVALWVQTQRLERLQQRAADQAAEIDGYREAARIQANYARRRAEIERQNDDLSRELQGMAGRDAPLSDHLRGAASRVWPDN